MKTAPCICILLILILQSHGFGGGTIIDDFFFSDALGEARLVDVYLPEGYEDGDTRYPVLYFLHGLSGDQDQYNNVTQTVDELITEGSIHPMIVVKPDDSGGPHGSCWYTNSELYGAHEDYIVNDLVTYIDGTYRTLATRERRAIFGHSMGGFGAMKLGLYHPDVYVAWASHSGLINLDPDSLWWDAVMQEYEDSGGTGPFHPEMGTFTGFAFSMAGAFSPNLENPPYYLDFPIDTLGVRDESVRERWERHYPAAIDSLDPLVWNQGIYFDCGDEDEYGIFPFNVAFAETLDRREISYDFQPFNGDHGSQLGTRLPISITFLDSVMYSRPITHKIPVER